MAYWRAGALLLLLGAACVNLARPPGLTNLDGGRADKVAQPVSAADARPDGHAPEVEDGAGQPEVAADAAPELAALVPNGQPCASAGEGCASGVCASGRCCDRACTGSCEACDVAGLEGTCSPVPAGLDPDNDCDEQHVTTCGRDGTCDGAGACRKHAAGAVCAPGRCSGTTEIAASTCDGNGACRAGTFRECAGTICTNGSCGAACGGPGDCQPGFYCRAGACAVTRARGEACTVDAECATGHCADGVCCTTTCPGPCHSCNLAPTRGSCTAIPDGQDPDRECPAESASTCRRAGGCDGRGACKLHAAGTVCAAGSCAGDVETAPRTCNGAGTCSAATTRACGAYACSGAACATSCSTSAACASGHVCNAPACVLGPKIASLVVHDTANASGWSIESDFRTGESGAHPWTDWPNSYVVSVQTAGNVILGKPWIRVVTESKRYTGTSQGTLTLSRAGDVYLFVDNRWSVQTWTAGWTDAGWSLTVYENASRPSLGFRAYVKAGVSGAVSLPRIADGQAYNYFIVVN